MRQAHTQIVEQAREYGMSLLNKMGSSHQNPQDPDMGLQRPPGMDRMGGGMNGNGRFMMKE